MALLVPDEGEVELLTRVVGLTCVYKLYQANMTPAEGDTLSTYSGDIADFSGYANFTAAWGIPATSGGTTFVTGSSNMFQHNGGATSNTIYGYYVTDGSNTKLYWAEKFAASKSMAAPADIIQLIPRLQAE